MLLLLACAGSPDDSPARATGTKENPEISLRFVLDGDPALAEVQLAPYDPAAPIPVGDVAFTFTGPDAVAGLAVAAPDAALRLVVDPEEAPDMRVATFVPARLEGDALVGIGLSWPTWVEGEIPASYADIGLVAGWNAVYIDADHRMFAEDPLAIELPANMNTVASFDLSGSAEAGAAGLVGAFLGELTYAEIAATNPWSLALDGDPAQSGDLPDYAASGALLPLRGFDDADGSGGWSAADPVRHGICADGVPVVAAWLDPAEAIGDALERQRRGYVNGWNLFTNAETPATVSPDALVAGPDCPEP